MRNVLKRFIVRSLPEMNEYKKLHLKMTTIILMFVLSWGSPVIGYIPFGPAPHPLHPIDIVPPGHVILSPGPFPHKRPHFFRPVHFVPPQMAPMLNSPPNRMVSGYGVYQRGGQHVRNKNFHNGRKRLIILRRQHTSRKMHRMNKMRRLAVMRNMAAQRGNRFQQQRGFQPEGPFQQRRRSPWRGMQGARTISNGQGRSGIGSGAFAGRSQMQNRGIVQQRPASAFNQPRLKEVVNSNTLNRFPIENKLSNRRPRTRRPKISGKTLDFTNKKPSELELKSSREITHSQSKSAQNAGRSNKVVTLSETLPKPTGDGAQTNLNKAESGKAISGIAKGNASPSKNTNVNMINTEKNSIKNSPSNKLLAREMPVSNKKTNIDQPILKSKETGIAKDVMESTETKQVSVSKEKKKMPTEEIGAQQQKMGVQQETHSQMIDKNADSVIQSPEQTKSLGTKTLIPKQTLVASDNIPRAKVKFDVSGALTEIINISPFKTAGPAVNLVSEGSNGMAQRSVSKKTFATVAQAENPIPTAETIEHVNSEMNNENIGSENNFTSTSITGDLLGASEIIPLDKNNILGTANINMNSGASIIDLAAHNGALPDSLSHIGHVDIVTVDSKKFANLERAIKHGKPINSDLLTNIIQSAGKNLHTEKASHAPTDTEIIIIDTDAAEGLDTDTLSLLSPIHEMKEFHPTGKTEVHGMHPQSMARAENLIGGAHHGFHDVVGTVGDSVGSIAVDGTNEILGLFSVQAGNEFPNVPASVSSIPESIGKMLNKHKKKGLTKHKDKPTTSNES